MFYVHQRVGDNVWGVVVKRRQKRVLKLTWACAVLSENRRHPTRKFAKPPPVKPWGNVEFHCRSWDPWQLIAWLQHEVCEFYVCHAPLSIGKKSRNAGWHSFAIMASTNREIWARRWTYRGWKLRDSRRGAVCAMRGISVPQMIRPAFFWITSSFFRWVLATVVECSIQVGYEPTRY